MEILEQDVEQLPQVNLTANQMEVFNAIEQTSHNFLISGEPGVGKSVLIRYLVENGQKYYVLGAPTGLAALNIGGRTLHSIFRIPVSQGILHPTYNQFTLDDKTLNYIKYGIKHLIIDEVSMVRADAFDYIDRLMRMVKGVDRPFGGIQIIIVGDFFQLPPVVVREEVTQMKDAGYASPFVFSSHVFQNNFKVKFLSEVIRQKGDPEFLDILAAARYGHVNAKHVKRMNDQVGVSDGLRISLTGTNALAEQINKGRLRGIQGDSVKFTAQKYGEWPALPVDEFLELKIGAQVMVKMNRADRPPRYKGEFTSRVVNGSIGIVTDIYDGAVIERKENESPDDVVAGVPYVKIKLESGEEVKIWLKRWERKIKEKVGDEWDERIVASYEQIPLTLAWAISIHKSQGQTFDKVHIDATKIFAPGQLYVAFSRCRTLAGISLQDRVDSRKFFANRSVLNFFDDYAET